MIILYLTALILEACIVTSVRRFTDKLIISESNAIDPKIHRSGVDLPQLLGPRRP